jgi:hypothetical protein
MPHGLTDYVNDAIMQKLLLGTSLPAGLPLSTIYVGISSTAPDRAGNNVTEPSTGGYARRPIVCSPTANTQWKKRSPGIYQSKIGVQFPLPTAQWWPTPEQSVLYWDSPTLGSGNLVSFATQMQFPVQINQYGASIYFPADWLLFGINPWWSRRGQITQWWADQLAAWLCTGASISWPSSLWAALCSVMPVATDTGSTITEPSGPANSGAGAGACYSRQNMGTNWVQSNPGRYKNSGTVFWPYPTSSPL